MNDAAARRGGGRARPRGRGGKDLRADEPSWTVKPCSATSLDHNSPELDTISSSNLSFQSIDGAGYTQIRRRSTCQNQARQDPVKREEAAVVNFEAKRSLNSEVLVFGSFTEDETRSLLGQPSVNSNKQAPKFLSGTNFAEFRGHPKVEMSSAKGLSQVTKENEIGNVKHVVDDVPRVRNAPNENGSLNSNAKTSIFANGTRGQGTSHFERMTFDGVQDDFPPINRFSNLQVTEADTDDRKGRLANGSVARTKLTVTSNCSVNKNVSDPMAEHFTLLPRGLINSGNLCFLNSTLQALLSCPPFFQLLQDLKIRDVSKDACPTITAFIKFVSDFEVHRSAIPAQKNSLIVETAAPFSPSMFQEVLKIFTPDVPSGMAGRPRQEDSQEFLSFIMDQMHNELLKIKGQSSDVGGGNFLKVSSTEDDEWETVGPKNKSAVTRTQSFIPSELSAIFGGQLRSVVKARGNKASATVQPYLLLHLDIFPEAVHTVEDALHAYSAPETLEGYKASVTGQAGVVSAMKSVQIQKLSKIMILHLMRFSYGSEGSTKLHKPVHFPLEFVLSRDLLVSPTTESRRYELVATITHHGRDPSKGHYTTDARHPNGQWLHYDDASVTGIGVNRVLHDQAYVLFYRQL